ncbi:hypothetical protein DB347_17835 [Opitutaceae bacterium EW11]|nr:hypothetical protein DB347_17835 [Opitutaceae bacterium EW11]
MSKATAGYIKDEMKTALLIICLAFSVWCFTSGRNSSEGSTNPGSSHEAPLATGTARGWPQSVNVEIHPNHTVLRWADKRIEIPSFVRGPYVYYRLADDYFGQPSMSACPAFAEIHSGRVTWTELGLVTPFTLAQKGH